MFKPLSLALFAMLFVGTAFAAPAAAKNPQVKFTTTMGVIVVELDPKKAPKTVANFLDYVKKGHYDGTTFHRVIPNFMIQGGGFEPGFKQKPTDKPIQNEADNGLKNMNGTIAMARTGDPHSATAQFFINTKDNDFLNHSGKNPQGWGYTVFGKVVQGMDVVKKIEAVPTGRVGPFGDAPKTDVVIKKAEIVGAAKKDEKAPAKK